MGLHAEVFQPRRRQTHADHLHVGHDVGAAPRLRTEQQIDAGAHGIRVETGQAVEIEVGIGVDHAPHDRPLFVGVGVRTGFLVDDGEAAVLDGLAGTGELFGNGVDGAHGFWRSECRK